MTALFIAYGLALTGSFISLLNFHLSITRPLMHHYFHASVPYRNVSVFPLFGSLLLWFSSFLFWWCGHTEWALIALAVSAFDTGGLHWFTVVMCVQAARPEQRP